MFNYVIVIILSFNLIDMFSRSIEYFFFNFISAFTKKVSDSIYNSYDNNNIFKFTDDEKQELEKELN